MKTTILKTTFFAFILILVAAACTPDDSSSELSLGDLVVTIDGAEFKSIGTIGAISDTFGIQGFTITGVKNNGLTGIEEITLIFALPSGQSVMNTTYESDFNTDGDCDGENTICSGLEYTKVDALDPNGALNYNSVGMDGNSKITFTELDYQKGGLARGTFSGTIVDADGGSIIVTNGAFYVNIID